MSSVFISYVQRDRPDFVVWLSEYLNQLPNSEVHAWYDQQLSPADERDLTFQIQPRLEHADFVLVILTKGVENESSYVHKEVAFALDRKKIVIPLLVEECKVPLLLADRLWIDFTADKDIAISRLVQYIKGEVPFPRSVPLMTHSVRAAYHQYLRVLIQRLGVLPISSIDLLSDEQLRLDQLWIPLNTTTPEESLNLPSRRLRGPRQLSVLQILGQHEHLVLMGDPGAGKSTVARYVALCLAGAELNDFKVLPLGLSGLGIEWSAGQLCPIYIELREFAAKASQVQTPSGDDLLRYILTDVERSPSSEGFASELRQQLADGHCVVLLDGMDEVPQAMRRRLNILECVRDFCRRYTNCRILVTTRTYAYRRSDWRLDGFEEAEIAPFDNEQIGQYVDQWYIALARQRPHIAGRNVALKRELTARPDDLGFLAKRPLLLALMASLHSRTNDTLPESRATLYRYITQLLLEHWEKSKIVVNSTTGDTEIAPSSLSHFIGHGISLDSLRAAINLVAFEAQRDTNQVGGDSDITAERLAITLRRFIRRDPNAAPLPSEFDLVDELKDRSGILMAYDEDVYRFPHRTFQEYMAACHLCSDDIDHGEFPGELVRLVGEDPERWREVTIFAAGEVIQNRRYVPAWQLIDALVPDPPEEADDADPFDKRWYAVFYAGLALTTNRIPQPSRGAFRLTYGRTVSWLEKLIQSGALSARDRCDAALALARLDDPRNGVSTNNKRLPQLKWSDDILGGRIDLGPDDALQRVSFTAFQVSVYCVTNAQYQSFIDAPDGWTNPIWWGFSQDGLAWRQRNEQPAPAIWDEPTCPRTNVTWYEVMAFCSWLSSKPGYEGVRLPTEMEWEYAARGMDRRLLPWGDNHAVEHANVRHSSETDEGYNLDRVSPVGIYPQGSAPCGALDMLGNVFEWCHTELQQLPYDAYDGREDEQGVRGRCVRGGSWRTTLEQSKLPVRGQLAPWDRHNDCGFRLCRSI